MPPSSEPIDDAAVVHYPKAADGASDPEGRTVRVRHCEDTDLDIELYYESFGRPSDPAVLLINGLGMHCHDYDTAFCEMLSSRDLYVIRFDNRDVGLSTKVVCKEPALWKFLLPACCCCCCPEKAPYPLSAMADDAAALLSAIGIHKAHVSGYSMGGMIAQLFAIRYPDRCLSMTSIMSMTGNRDIKDPEFWVKRVLIDKPKSDEPADILAFRVYFEEKILTTGTRIPSAEERYARSQKYLGRSIYRKGTPNQAAAIVTSPPRDEQLKELKMPVLVVHGERDVLVPPENGKHTSKCIPGSTLLLIPEMGHFIGPFEFGLITDAMLAMINRIEGRSL